MRTFFVTLILVVSWASQAQAPKTPEKPPALCRVSGRVVSAVDGAPLRSSRVVLIQENVKSHPKVFGATTDADGHFEIKDVTAGRYNFVASHEGYVDRQYKAQAAEEGAVLSLEPGQEFTDALFRLVRAGVIAGRILDENGEPLAKVSVTAMRKPTADEAEDEGPRHSHKEELITAAAAFTDDLGQFRLFGLEPGSYYIKASESGESFMYFANRGSDTERLAQEALGSEYVPLYYPGVVSFDEAQSIAVHAGDEMAADFNMRHVSSTEISGKVIGPDGRPSSRAWVELEATGVEEDGFGDFSSSTNDSGEFSLKNIPPGTYLLTATDYDDQKVWKASQKIEVGERKIDSLVLALGRGTTLNGRVSFAGSGTAPDADRIFLSLEPVTESDDTQGAWARVKKDGKFEIPDVSEGSYAIHVSCRDTGWYVKSIRFGPDDILEKGLQIEKGSTGGSLEIVMSSAAAQVEGSVTQDDKPAVAAHVSILPDPDTPYNHSREHSTSTDQNGHFAIAGLAPGKYRVSAKLRSDSGPPTATAEPQTLTLRENDHQTVQLVLQETKPQ